jgi:hypothetical protein
VVIFKYKSILGIMITNFNSRKIKKLLSSNDFSTKVASLLILVVFVVVGVHLNFKSHAAVPTSPSISDVCGTTSAINVGVSSPVIEPAQSTALGLVLNDPNNSGSNFKIFNNNGILEAYVMNSYPGSNYQQQEITIYNLSNGVKIGNPFPVDVFWNTQDNFTIDPSGNVYVVSGPRDYSGANAYVPSIAAYSPSGIQLHYQAIADGNYGGTYSYTDSLGNWYFAFTDDSKLTGSADYNKTGQSEVFNSAFIQQPNNNMVFTSGDIQQDTTTKDILGFYNSDTVHVYKNSSTLVNGISTYPLKFQMGTDLQNGAAGPFSFNQPKSIIENPNGGYYVSSWAQGILSFDSNGGYLGSSPDSDSGGNSWVASRPGNSTIIGSDLYYYTNSNSLYGPASSGIYKVSLANLNTYITSPWSPNHLGLGAGMSTAKTSNYFMAGSTPAVNMTFYPWWGANSANFKIQYQVRSINQLLANQNTTEQSFNLSSYMSSSTTAITNVPLNISGNTTPGAYQISARIYNVANPSVALGADCIDYSVGNSNNSYNQATIKSSPSNFVETAHQLGQNLVRATYGLDDCISSSALNAIGFNPNSPSTTLSSVPVVDCTGSGYTGNSNIAATSSKDTSVANSYGMMYILQLADYTTPLDSALEKSTTTTCPGFYSGTSINDFQCVAYLMAKALPNVTTWEGSNEITLGNFTASSALNTVIKPAYVGIHQAGSELGKPETVIAGSFIGTATGVVNWISSIITADNGTTNYMDGLDNHAYGPTNDNLSELGTVVPLYDAIPGSASGTGGLDQIVKAMNGKPVIDTEFGSWQSGTTASANQGNNIVTGTILQNSIGIKNISVFENSQCGGDGTGLNWGSVGCGHDGGDLPSTLAQTTMQSELDGSSVSANRAFIGWLPTGATVSGQYTGDPHTYAAEYGASGTNTNHIVTIWADDYTNTVVPSLSGGGIINVTGEFGSSSSIASGTLMTIKGEVQYVDVPAGQTLSFAAAETYGPNLALATSGATVSTSSTSTCIGISNTNIISGSENLKTNSSTTIYNSCNSQINGWSQHYSDNNPSITINMSSLKTIDRVLLSGTSGFSVNPKVGSYTIQTSIDSTTWTTAAIVPDQIYQRNHMAYFSPINAQYVKIVINNVDFTGTANGMPPLWWGFNNLTDDTQPSYGPANVYDVEIYAQGTGGGSAKTPLSSLTAPAASSYVHGTVNLTASVSDQSGTGLAKVDYLNSTLLLGTVMVTPYSYSWNTLSGSVPNTKSYPLSAKAFDNAGNTTTSAYKRMC